MEVAKLMVLKCSISVFQYVLYNHLRNLSFNKSSAVTEMAMHSCTTGTVKRCKLHQFSVKIVTEATVMIHIMPKFQRAEETFGYIFVADTASLTFDSLS